MADDRFNGIEELVLPVERSALQWEFLARVLKNTIGIMAR